MFKGFMSEFKKFAMRGNVIDMAVGIIIGAAFGKIVDSLVKDVLMPPIGLLLGKVDFSDLKFVLTEGENPVSINYGLFINALISFVIVAFAVFVLIKAINKLQEKMKDWGNKVLLTSVLTAQSVSSMAVSPNQPIQDKDNEIKQTTLQTNDTINNIFQNKFDNERI